MEFVFYSDCLTKLWVPAALSQTFFYELGVQKKKKYFYSVLRCSFKKMKYKLFWECCPVKVEVIMEVVGLVVVVELLRYTILCKLRSCCTHPVGTLSISCQQMSLKDETWEKKSLNLSYSCLTETRCPLGMGNSDVMPEKKPPKNVFNK